MIANRRSRPATTDTTHNPRARRGGRWRLDTPLSPAPATTERPAMPIVARATVPPAPPVAAPAPASVPPAAPAPASAAGDGPCLLDLAPALFKRRELDGISDLDGDQSRWHAHIEKHPLARMPVRKIDTAAIRGWVDDRLQAPAQFLYPGDRAGQIVSRDTVKNVLYLLSALFKDLVLQGVVESNPCEGVKVRRKRRVEEASTYLRLAEVRRTRAAFARRCSTAVGMRAMVAFLLFIGAGFREGEARALRCGRVHFDAAGKPVAIDVREGRPGKPPKSRTGRRTVRIFGFAADAIEIWRAYTGLDFAADPNRLVFESRPGEAFFRNALLPRRILRAVLTEAGITRRFRTHDLRHTCAALLVSGDLGYAWSLEAIRAFLGHSSITMTERYAHLQPQLVDRAAEATEAAIATAKAAKTKKPAPAERGAEGVPLG